jgi:hypothetical protein
MIPSGAIASRGSAIQPNIVSFLAATHEVIAVPPGSRAAFALAAC